MGSRKWSERALTEDALAAAAIVLDKVAALRHKVLDDAVKVAALVRQLAATLLALAPVAKHKRHEILDGERCDLRPDFKIDALRRQFHTAAALLRPLEIIDEQRLLDAFELRPAKLRQPVRGQIVCDAGTESDYAATALWVRARAPWRRTCKVFGTHKIDGALV